jgi:hypothetical protein
MKSIVRNSGPRDVTSTFNYYRDPIDGSPPAPIDVCNPPAVPRVPIKKEAIVHDIRGSEDQYTLDKEGFQFVKHRSVEKDFVDDDRVTSVYYREIEDLVQKV